MLGLRSASRKANQDEAEKPFWISFSDLMTALMVLFLVVMTAALLSVTDGIRNIENQENNRVSTIGSCMAEVRGYTQTIPGVQIREHSVDFGPLAKFPNNSSDLTPAQQAFLRRFVPRVLAIARTSVCQQWLKQIVVEGFASQSGSYLHNLHLSTERSERVLCTLLEPAAGERLGEADRELVRNLFFAGGYSFNSTKENDDESRRIELKLEFYALKEKQQDGAPPSRIQSAAFRPNANPGSAKNDNDTSCPIDLQ